MSIKSLTAGVQEKKTNTTDRYKSDGTINRGYISPSRQEYYGKRAQEDDKVGRSSNETLKAMAKSSAARRRNKKENDAQEKLNRKRRLAGRRANESERNAETMSARHFSPYADHIRKAKDKQQKKLKQMAKRSYYEDV